MLSVWPPLPIFIRDSVLSNSEMDNVIAALEHNDCASLIILRVLPVSRLQLEIFWAAMQEPFPVLTQLYLG